MIVGEVSAPIAAILRDTLTSGPALGVAATLEALAVVGAAIPMTPILVWLGAAVAAGGGQVWLLAWILGGALLGSSLSFEAARFAGPALLRRWSLLRRAHLRAAPAVVRRGAVLIVLSRLVGGAAGVFSFAAGLTGMRRRTFYASSFAANLFWVSATAALGYLAALGWRQVVFHKPSPASIPIAAALVIIVALCAAGRISEAEQAEETVWEDSPP